MSADIILALGYRGLGAVRSLQCDHVVRESTGENGNENDYKLAAPIGIASSAEENEGKNVTYSYTLWIGSNVTDTYSLILTSSKNTSFYKAMMQAADSDQRYFKFIYNVVKS